MYYRQICVLILYLWYPVGGQYIYNYVGCYREQQDWVVSGESFYRHGDNTIEKCVEFCGKRGYTYAGLQEHMYCICGNSEYAKYGEGDGCTYLCAGNSNQMCGGVMQNSVFRISEVAEVGPATTHSTVTSPSESGQYTYNYIGCYREQQDWVMSGESFYRRGDNTIEKCVEFCGKRDYTYAGLQDRMYCFCGNSEYDKYGERDGCTYPCAGNGNQMCGGVMQNSVFHIRQYTYNYVGCYKDQEDWLHSGFYCYSDNTIEKCVEYCGKGGYTYSGLQYSMYCFCGNSGYDEYGEGDGCTYPCAGNSSQMCGGEMQNSVFHISKVTEVVPSPTHSIATSPSDTDGVAREAQTTNTAVVGVSLGASLIIALVVIVLLVVFKRQRSLNEESRKISYITGSNYARPVANILKALISADDDDDSRSCCRLQDQEMARLEQKNAAAEANQRAAVLEVRFGSVKDKLESKEQELHHTLVECD